ncbi:MAG: hypothetical protein COB66_04340 [Coxiella sp. (in: Bacteria)]|nr:MAG: hypothetical protein COB66_04340 [Coxiella sp. (in: g-proteobacteria)]
MSYFPDPVDRRNEWFRYYSEKRVTHQWLQVNLLKDLKNVHSVLEIGPYLGLVSSLLHNAGFNVTTLDYQPSQYPHPDIKLIQKDLLDASPAEIQGFDCIICCETLEHFFWDDVDKLLEKFYLSKAPWVVISVPYQGFQIDLSLYLNRYKLRNSFSMKNFKFLKKFCFDSKADPYGHKWEVGYKKRSVKMLEAKIRRAGFSIETREFTSACRSIFFVLKNNGV